MLFQALLNLDFPVLQKEKEEQKLEKKLKTELAGFGSKKTIEKSRNVFSVSLLPNVIQSCCTSYFPALPKKAEMYQGTDFQNSAFHPAFFLLTCELCQAVNVLELYACCYPPSSDKIAMSKIILQKKHNQNHVCNPFCLMR